MDDYWSCHQCDRVVYRRHWANCCPDCRHEKCSSCRELSWDNRVRSVRRRVITYVPAIGAIGPITTEATKATGISADNIGQGAGAASSSIIEDTTEGFERCKDTTSSIKDSNQLENATLPTRPLSRSSSLTSIPESVFSTVSGSSQSSIRGLDGAGREIAWLLLNHSKLQPLWDEVTLARSLGNIEQNLTRHLNMFSVALKVEAVTLSERLFAEFLRAEAKQSAHWICKFIDFARISKGIGTGGRVDLLKLSQKLEELESGGRYNRPIDLRRHEKFLVNSLAFEAFWKNLQMESFVSKETELELWSILPFAELEPGDPLPDVWKDLKSLRNLSRSLVKVRNKLFKHPPIAKGLKRITWTCVSITSMYQAMLLLTAQQPCGKAMYDDYEELERGAAKRFQRELRRMFFRQNPGDATETTRTPISFITSFSSVISTLVKKYLTRSRDLPTFELRPQGQPLSPTPEENLQIEHLYLLLCLCESRRVTTMRAHQPAVHSIESDTSLFRMLQAYYSETRRRWWSWLLLWDLKRINFVQFEMYDKSLVDIRALHAIPPDHFSASYCYERSTLKPPIGSNLLMHFFYHPEDASAITPCFRKIPKKRKEKLSVCPVNGVSPGWGLCFCEGWSWRKILAWCCLIVVLASIGVCVLYWKFEHKIQDAVALGTFMLACFGIGVSTLQAWLIIK